MTTPLIKQSQIIALINFDDKLTSFIKHCDFEKRQLMHFETADDFFKEWDDKHFYVVAIISKSDILGKYGINLIETLNKKKFPSVPIMLVVKHLDRNLRKIALGAGVTDVFT